MDERGNSDEIVTLESPLFIVDYDVKDSNLVKNPKPFNIWVDEDQTS